MADEQTPRTAAPLTPVVADPSNAPMTYIDWIVTGGSGPSPGTVNIDLAALDYSLPIDGQPRAIIQTRLRMSVGTATNLHRFLAQLLFAATPAEPGGIN